MATTASFTTSFDLADQVALVSSELLRYRIRNRPSLDPQQLAALEDAEIELDKATARLRAQGIAALGEFTKPARNEIEAATTEAEAVLRRIRKIERALGIVASVLDLALAVVARKPQDALAAVKRVRAASRGEA